VILTGSNDLFFVTASHCTGQQWGIDTPASSSTWFQPFTPDSIATFEQADPPLFSGGSCPSGKFCRWSDAALVRYNNGNDWYGGTIAYPQSGTQYYPFPFAVRIVIDQSQPLPLGNQIYKVGGTTGFAAGTRARTCITVALSATISLLCQYTAVGLINDGGDSGGPVFYWAGFLPATAKMAGIHWGKGGLDTTVFSPVSGLNKDLGFLRYDLQ
jgi:hypothetical protein